MTIEHTDRGPLDKDELAALVAADIPDGAFVNLGIGQPTTVADHLSPELSPEHGVVLHTENDMLGMGRAATMLASSPGGREKTAWMDLRSDC